MRLFFLLLSVCLAVELASPAVASADEVVYCWYEEGGNYGGSQQLHCRLVGGETVVYRDRGEVPGPLYPAVGDDGDGECWFERSLYTGWESFGINGTLNLLYFNPDGTPGGPLIAAAWFERCAGEPTVIETIFAWPGMGKLTVEAVGGRDYPLIMATTTIAAVLTVLGNLLADVTYAIVDPRVTYGGKPKRG